MNNYINYLRYFIFIILASFLQSCDQISVLSNKKNSAVAISSVTSSHISEKIPSYNRKFYKHWSDSNRNCLDTRQEILLERSIVAPTLNKKKCKVKAGLWKDFYYAEELVDVKEIDIDHIVPLKNAHESGAHAWPSEKKEIFANDLENLVITNKRYNRQKGSKTIAQWLPVEKEYACKYIHNWIHIKEKYQLKLSPEENQTIAQMGSNCQDFKKISH